MNIQLTFRACLELLKKQPKGSSIAVGKTQVSCEEAYNALNRVTEWCFPGLDSIQFEKIVHCRECENYRKFRKKGAPKKTARYLCALDKIHREPWYYCGDAKERRKTDE